MPTDEQGMVARQLWRLAGGISVLLGVIGIFLPLLPTTPFLLLAAYCFQRSSPALHAWLINHPRLGPSIRDWREHGAISQSAKIQAVAAMVVVLGVSFLLGVNWTVLTIQLVVLCCVAVFILSRPGRPDE